MKDANDDFTVWRCRVHAQSMCIYVTRHLFVYSNLHHNVRDAIVL